MTQTTAPPVFATDLPPDLEHSAMIREEAIDWLEKQFPGANSFSTREVLRMAGEQGRRWLISRLRAHDIGNESELDLSATADALTVLFLRSRGIKFRDAVDSVVGREPVVRGVEFKYGGLWNRLLVSSLDRLRRRIPPRLLGSALFSVIRDRADQPNCLFIVRRLGLGGGSRNQGEIKAVTHDYVYRAVVERPAPICAVISPSRELLFLPADKMPTRAEVTSRHFIGLEVATNQYRNFYLVPTLMGQGMGYLLNRAPGPTASRLQAARKSFPKDDLFYREYIFAKCWEQGLHWKYGALLSGDGWEKLQERLHQEFGGS